MCMEIHIYMHAITIGFLKQQTMNLKKSRRGLWEVLEGGERKEECCNYKHHTMGGSNDFF